MIKLCAFSDEAAESLKGQIAALHRNDIALTELRGVNGKNVSVLTESEAKEIRRELNGEGISVWSVGSPLGKSDISVSLSEFSEQVKTVCGIADCLGADKIRAFSFFNAYDKAEKVIEYLNRAAEIARSFGVTLCHENEKEVYGDTCARVGELMRDLVGWQFVYDPANFVQVGESAETCLPLAKKCLYYHIKDVIAGGGENVPAGEGDGNISGLIDLIDKDTVLTVEPHLIVFGSYSQIDKTEMKLKYEFKDNDAAFDAAVSALKSVLDDCGYKYAEGGYIK